MADMMYVLRAESVIDSNQCVYGVFVMKRNEESSLYGVDSLLLREMADGLGDAVAVVYESLCERAGTQNMTFRKGDFPDLGSQEYFSDSKRHPNLVRYKELGRSERRGFNKGFEDFLKRLVVRAALEEK